METKKYLLGCDQKWAWPKMGVANFEKNEKILTFLFVFLNIFLKERH